MAREDWSVDELLAANPSSKRGICLTSIIRNEKRREKNLSTFQKIPADALGEIVKTANQSRSFQVSDDFLDTFLYVYGMGFLQAQVFGDYPRLHTLTMGKIFELCYVAAVYGFAAGNPIHPQRDHVIRSLQTKPDAAADFEQLATFMLVNYNNNVLNDMVANQQCTKNAAIMQGVSNWLLLELIGDHQPQDVIPLTIRITKLLLCLTLDDLIEEQMQPLVQMEKLGASLAEIENFFIVKCSNELSRQFSSKTNDSIRKLNQILSDPIESEIKLIELASLKVITPEMRKTFPQIRDLPTHDIHCWCFAALLRKRVEDILHDDRPHCDEILKHLRMPQHKEIQAAFLELLDDQQETYEMAGPNSICNGDTPEHARVSNSLYVPLWLAGKLVDDRVSIVKLQHMLFDSITQCYHEAFN